jgi:catechol 2,3-dioxygenase-like lactoylglutathione lyase family enzyme
MEARLNIITLGVKDFDKAVAFYEQGLGWPKSSASQDDIAFFKLAGIVLSLYPREKLAEDMTIAPEGSGFSGVSIAYNARSEKEVDDVISKVEKLGATIVKRPQKVFWGGYSSYFGDLDGYLFEVAYNPFLELDEKGLLKMP